MQRSILALLLIAAATVTTACGGVAPSSTPMVQERTAVQVTPNGPSKGDAAVRGGALHFVGMEKDASLLLKVDLRRQETGEWRLAASVHNYSGQEIILHPTCEGMVRVEGREWEPVPCNPGSPLPLPHGETYQVEYSIPANELSSPTMATLKYGHGRTISASLQPPSPPQKTVTDCGEPMRPHAK
jgi:hypothetical protein